MSQRQPIYNLIVLILGILSVALFISYKWPALSLPFFWDEAWVYGPAVYDMGQRIPSLLPGSINIELSRGHPMLFHFLGGCWAGIFGNSLFSLHSFALTITITLLAVVYKISAQLSSSKYTGALIIPILLAQALFLAQSAMVLPEMLLSLLSLLALHFYAQSKYKLAAGMACLALLTKESAAILFPALFLGSLLDLYLLKNKNNPALFRPSMYLFIAGLPFLAFLAFQYHRFGWVFFPNHMELQVQDARTFQVQLTSALEFILLRQGRAYVTLSLIIILIYRFRKSMLFWAISTWMGMLLFWLFIFQFYRWWNYWIILIALVISFALFLPRLRLLYKKHHRFYLYAGVFTILFAIFTAYNFFSSRYVLVLVILYLLLAVKIIQGIKNPLRSILMLGWSVIGLIFSFKNHPASDTHPSYLTATNLLQELVLDLESKGFYTEAIVTPFLVNQALTQSKAGYRKTEMPFEKLIYGPPDTISFYNVVTSMEGEAINDNYKKDRLKVIVGQYEKNGIWIRLEKYSSRNKD